MNVKVILSRIEDRLIALGMSKEEFYKLSSISSATYSYWNTGKYNPTPKKLKSAAEVLGVTYEYLVTGEGQKNKPATPEGSELTEMQQKAVDMILNMSDAQLKAFIAAAEAFLR